MSSLFSKIAGTIEQALPDVIRRRYSAKFGVALLLVILMLVTAGVFIHLNTKSLVQSQTEAQIQGVAESEAQSVADWVATRRSTTSFLAGSIQDRGSGQQKPDAQRWLEQKLIELPGDTHSLHYIDRESGQITASTADDLDGRSFSDIEKPWASRANMENSGSQTIMSQPYETDGTAVVAFIRPVAGTDRAVVLTSSLSDRSHEFTSTFSTGDVNVVAADGTIVMDNRKASILDQYTTQDGSAITAIDSALSGDAGYKQVSARTGMEAGTYAMAYTPISGTDWALTYHLPADRAFALQTQVSENIALLIALAIGALFIIGVVMGRGTAKSLATVSENAQAIAKGDIDRDLPDTSRIDEMGQLYDSFAAMQTYLGSVAGQANALADQRFDDPVLEEEVPGEFGAALDTMQADLEEMITDIESAKREAEMMAESLETKAMEFSDVMSEAAAGDLTQRMSTDSDTEAMVEIAESFNAMLSEIQDTVGRIQTFSDDVAVVSEQMDTSVAEIKRSSENVTHSIQEIADGADDQTEQLQQVSDEMNNLSATIEEVAATAETVAEKSQETAKVGESGRETADTAIVQMQTIETKMQRAVDAVGDLNQRTDEIDEVVNVITDIAEQTNILALNASIEAAQSDTSSDGFEVVADEVKQLAEETKESTSEIESIINDVRSQVQTTVEDIEAAEEQIQVGTESVEETVDAFDSVVENVSETDHGVQEISSATDDQAASTQEVVAMADTAADISEQTAGEAKNVAAAAQEQTSAISEISQGADNLLQQAQKLEEELDQFTVESEATVDKQM